MVSSKNTRPEKIIFSVLKNSGYKFRRHYPITGKPDIAFPKMKIAVFIDGEFWHGRNFSKWKDQLSTFWLKKISENIKRDKEFRYLLKKKGWRVIRLWDKDILRNTNKEANKIIKFLN